MQAFQTRLRQRAKSLGLSDAEVARRAGLSERRYGHYVAGEREPNLATLVRISEVLALTPNDLLLPEPLTAPENERGGLEARFQSAINSLERDDLELALRQVECLISHRLSKAS